jgi:hypothetical protein
MEKNTMTNALVLLRCPTINAKTMPTNRMSNATVEIFSVYRDPTESESVAHPAMIHKPSLPIQTR